MRKIKPTGKGKLKKNEKIEEGNGMGGIGKKDHYCNPYNLFSFLPTLPFLYLLSICFSILPSSSAHFLFFNFVNFLIAFRFYRHSRLLQKFSDRVASTHCDVVGFNSGPLMVRIAPFNGVDFFWEPSYRPRKEASSPLPARGNFQPIYSQQPYLIGPQLLPYFKTCLTSFIK